MIDSYKLATKVAQAAVDKKAFDVKLLKIKDVSIITDYFVLASGSSTTQVHAIVENIEKILKEELGLKPLRIEGFTQGRWVLLDYSDVIVHIFLQEEREFYNLETLWGDAGQEEFTGV
ncbi:MAG: ribosome-associated protein [Clostridia bacterium]|nr:iojap-like protein [Clostridiales bacterium]MDK2984491.1 ribosome-associated protein [Clostridia bacterium]